MLFFLFWAYITPGLAQRYHFEQLDIEDGLAQSQATAITQDSKRRLWIATLGGVSVYNGTGFVNYTKTDGLNSNFALSVSSGQKNDLWIGTARGISTYDGQKFSDYKNIGMWGSRVMTDKNLDTYAIVYRKLYKMGSAGATLVLLSSDKKEKVTALNSDYEGNLWAAVYSEGIYYLKAGEWKKQDVIINSKLIISGILKDRFAKDKLWLLTEDELYICQSGSISKAGYPIKGKLTSIVQDQDRNLWIGTNNGAYRVDIDDKITHFNKKNGLTDNQVNALFIDIENNIWFGTDGSGIFKYNKHSYQTFDESQGLKNDIVMSLVEGEAQEILLGTYKGLFSFQHGVLKEINIPSSDHDSRKINTLFKDHKNNIWIGTPGGGLWLYKGKHIKKIDKESTLAYNAIMEDSLHRIWVSTNAGSFIVDQEQNKLVRVTSLFTSSLLELSKDSVIIGTQEGVYLIDHLKQVQLINKKELAESSILSMIKYQHLILFGTADNGLMIWDRNTGKISSITTKNGLASDHIYSLLADKDGIVWIGTGKGINRLDIKNLRLLKPAQLNLMVECNQNAILQTKHKIWIGTTKGAIVYDQKPQNIELKKPYVYLTGLSILSKEGNSHKEQDTTTFYNEQQLDYIPTLPFTKNNLIISFTAVYLTNPKAVSYQYRLLGLESKYSQLSSNTSINYTALPAGKYTFQVKALTDSGRESVNTAHLTFEINPPYYQTNLFRIIMVLLLILGLLFTVYTIVQLNERRRKLRLKIKLEEQFKIRKQTAEDFHDDLGNKLTRIAVLSDVLLSMVDEEDKAKRNIIHKIHSNVRELYSGTKDILWALNPKNDNLADLLNHIKDFGNELFNDTNINFSAQISTEIKDRRLSLPVGRNILLIFKEALHNCLKHSEATEVTFSATTNDELLEIKVQDDGSGFVNAHEQSGHGINNMNVRAKRIDAYLITESTSEGTTINLYVRLSTLNNFRNV